ncbi:M15 family metallopeptidase [Kribbella sp. NPDC056861]|uniref:M15 family metallopeptidase n=1 Tax=Kribbella sp. NPDC056861 TaxID=3154857 RepID=UPI003444A27F
MSRTTAPRPTALRTRGPGAIAVVVAVAAIVGALFYQSAASSISEVLHGGRATEADGVLPDDATVFAEQYPGVENLEPDLRRALQKAATAAAGEGIEFYVNSGWRSPAYQDQLLRQAVSKYGSEEEAARWVATPDTSPHVSGAAADIGHSDATTWLSDHGAEYGLCQIYRNEPWHYELRPKATSLGCPAPYADPTQDPRMR